jgi:hypothetical protein
MAGEAAHMHLVHDGLRGRPAQRRVALPVVGGRIDHHALHRGRAVVTGLAGGSAIVASGDGDAAAIGVEEDLAGIEAHTARGIPRPRDAIAVDLADDHAGNEDVPVVIGAIGGRVDPDHARGAGAVVNVIEEQQLDPGRMLREHAEVHPSGDGVAPSGQLDPRVKRGDESGAVGRFRVQAPSSWCAPYIRTDPPVTRFEP